MPDTHFYRYDDFDRTLVAERVEQFRDQVRRRLAGELTEEQFKPLRLTNGLYLQLHAYMLRIAIPYGTLSSRQLRKLAEIARKYDRGYGHFTTRQNLQLNWIKLEDAPDALAALAEVDMHAIQTIGQRASATSPPIISPVRRPTRSRIRASGARSSASGRRSIPSSPSCRASSRSPSPARPTTAPRCASHDVGLRLWRNRAGEVGFEVIVGGGLGRTPMIGKTLREFLPKDELLAYLEAVLRVNFNSMPRTESSLTPEAFAFLDHQLLPYEFPPDKTVGTPELYARVNALGHLSFHQLTKVDRWERMIVLARQLVDELSLWTSIGRRQRHGSGVRGTTGWAGPRRRGTG